MWWLYWLSGGSGLLDIGGYCKVSYTRGYRRPWILVVKGVVWLNDRVV